jgi:hypothetical protein
MPATLRLVSSSSQRDALDKVASIIRKGSIDPRIVAAARAITRDCAPRDDECELRAIYEAVKYGTDAVAWLHRGMRYVADPHSFDTFSTVNAIVNDCAAGSCAGDCDDATILVGSLAAAIGFRVGARAWGRGKNQAGDYQHVYAVAAIPKSGPWPRDYYGTALDTTVDRFDVGDEPDGGHILTAWLDGE